ncbi:hypothetical protein MASR2M70_19870 [Bacillota bacterium]
MHYPYIPEEQPALPVQNPIPVQKPATEKNPLVQTIEFTGTESPFGSTGMPVVAPKPPHFSVPSNPLLPGEYKEIISYENLQYMNGFLRTQIGKECMVVMTLGASGNVVSRLGYLIGVGINYLLLQDSCSEGIIVCDFYAIHLVQIFGKRCPVNLFI